MRKFLWFFFMWSGITNRSGAQNSLTIGAGSQLVFSSGAYLSLTDIGQVNNNGGFAAAGGTVVIRSAVQHSVIGGSTAWNFHTLSIDDAAGVELGRPVVIGHSLSLVHGNLDLKGNTISLSDTAMISGESELARLYDDAAVPGYVTITQDLAASPHVNPGGLGIEIDATTGAPGSTTITRWCASPGGASAPAGVIQRYYRVSPTNDAGLGASARFYYLDAELKGADPLTAVLYKSTDNGGTWSMIMPDARDTTDKYIQKNGIDDFSLWAMGAPGTDLPLQFLSFGVSCSDVGVLLQWTTAQEVNTGLFELERSNDGAAWTTVAQVAALGTGSSYSYSDNSGVSGAAFYRIQEVDKDGMTVYSPIAHSSCMPSGVITQVYPNPAPGYTNLLFSTPAGGDAVISVYDAAGRSVRTIAVVLSAGTNTIRVDLSGLAAGVYLLSLRGKETTVTRAVKVF
jgi:hypothetical protein